MSDDCPEASPLNHPSLRSGRGRVASLRIETGDMLVLVVGIESSERPDRAGENRLKGGV